MTSTRKLSSSEPQLEAGKTSPTSRCPLPLSNHLFHITFVHRYQRTRTSSIVRSIRRFGRILGGRIRYLRRLSVFKVPDGEQDLPGCLSTRRLGSRQPHQYRNHDRVPIRVVADSGWIRHAREGGIHSVQGRILQNSRPHSFAAPVTAGSRGRWYDWRRMSRVWTRIWRKRWTLMGIGPLREISKRFNEGLHDVDGFRGVCVHPE